LLAGRGRKGGKNERTTGMKLQLRRKNATPASLASTTDVSKKVEAERQGNGKKKKKRERINDLKSLLKSEIAAERGTAR